MQRIKLRFHETPVKTVRLGVSAQSAMTLVELLVVSVVMIILAGGLLATFLNARIGHLAMDAAVSVQEEARRAFRFMLQDLREAGQVSTTNLPNGSIQLNFQIARGYNLAGCPEAVCWGSDNADGEWMHYSIVDGPGNIRQLIRCANTNQNGAITVFQAGCQVVANRVNHPNTSATDVFSWDGATRTVTIRLETEFQDSALPTGRQTTGVLTSRVVLRNP